jgi:hypothetical protein
MLAAGNDAFGIAAAFTFNACTFLPLLIALLTAIQRSSSSTRQRLVRLRRHPEA